MAGEDRQNVHFLVQGEIGIMKIIKPGVSKQSNNPQYQLSIQNPTFKLAPNQNVNQQLVDFALQKLQMHVNQSQEYPTPSILLTLPLYNLNSDKLNRVHFLDINTKGEFLPKADLASGQPIIAEVDTYHTDSPLTEKFGHRTSRLANVYVQDQEQIRYYTPQSNIPAGFTPLSEEELNSNAPVPPKAPAPQFNNNTPTAEPFSGNGQNNGNFNSFGGNTNQQGTNANPYGSGQNAQTMAPNSQWQQNSVTPSSSNPLLGGQNNGNQNVNPAPTNNGAQNTGMPNFNGGNQNANPAPTNNGVQNTGMPSFNGGNQNANPAPTNNGAQNTGMPSFNGGNQNANPAPTNNGTQFNAGTQNANQNNMPFNDNNNNAPQDPFSQSGDTIDISDDDLPF